jgi:aryl-phospho-beta-D-glucosidase BglC (GH1 family)
MSILTAVQKNGWELVEAMQTSETGTYVVISKRPSSPFGNDHLYVTHKYYSANDGLHHGHYDMTLAQAVESMNARAN